MDLEATRMLFGFNYDALNKNIDGLTHADSFDSAAGRRELPELGSWSRHRYQKHDSSAGPGKASVGRHHRGSLRAGLEPNNQRRGGLSTWRANRRVPEGPGTSSCGSWPAVRKGSRRAVPRPHRGRDSRNSSIPRGLSHRPDRVVAPNHREARSDLAARNSPQEQRYCLHRGWFPGKNNRRRAVCTTCY
jgi:hypothetical protein